MYHGAMQVLNLAANCLRKLPWDLGWLQLKHLNVSENQELQMPPAVLRRGLKAVMSYLQVSAASLTSGDTQSFLLLHCNNGKFHLQVVGEQHRMVEQHMSSFTEGLQMPLYPSSATEVSQCLKKRCCCCTLSSCKCGKQW